MEAELYYICVPDQRRVVAQPIEFVTIAELLADEPACKVVWDLLTSNFKTRSKFLTIWPSVRYAALCRNPAGQVAGFLLVSSPLNWQIDYVTVSQEMRKKGIAAALVNETLNQALARNVPYVMLTSREGLRPLYEGQCGFTVVSRVDPAAKEEARAARLPWSARAM